MAADAARFTELEAEDSPWWPRACYLEGAAARLSGDPELARRRLEEGERLASAFGAITVRAMCLAQLAALAVAEDSWALASALAKQATDELSKASLDGIATVAPVFAVSALVQAHEGEVESARATIRHARALIEGDSGVAAWVAVEVRLTLAHASLLLADAAAARLLLSEARRVDVAATDLGSLNATLEELTATAAAFSAAGNEGASSLTGAEVRLLRLLPTHLTFAEIGERVHLSRNTVKSQAVSMYRKLDVSSRNDAVERATELGLL
jgi:LuxR family maltose regulon positive regulatory protein